MTLTTNGKNYIATYFGSNNCYAASGLLWTSVGTGSSGSVNETGGTPQIVARLVQTSIYDHIVVGGTSYYYSQLRSANDNTDITLTDAAGMVGVTYCATSTPPPSTPPPYTTPPPIGPGAPGGVINILPIPTGTPQITLDVSRAKLQQSMQDYHLEINNLIVVNKTQYTTALAFEVRLFQGAQTTCPTSGQVFVGMDRSLTTDPITGTHSSGRARIIMLGTVGRMVNLDIFQPPSIIGIHTVCIYVHGAWTQDDLTYEISGITG